jgi:DNA-binding response OmpR family regulator
MVFGIVQQHQGWVECHSEPGRGTYFSLYLPRHDVAEIAPAPIADANAPPCGKETILLVDDEQMIRNLGRTILERHGYEVLLAVDGQEAVDVYQREEARIDLVILDLTMPRLSGQDALRELLRINPHVRVLFASGYSAEHLIEADHGRVLGFVAKPYRPRELAHCVRAALDKPAGACATAPITSRPI